jgi:hypothetical protein
MNKLILNIILVFLENGTPPEDVLVRMKHVRALATSNQGKGRE